MLHPPLNRFNAIPCILSSLASLFPHFIQLLDSVMQQFLLADRVARDNHNNQHTSNRSHGQYTHQRERSETRQADAKDKRRSFWPSEEAETLGKLVHHSLRKTAKLLRCAKPSDVALRLHDAVKLIVRISVRLFPYHGDGSAHTQYIRDGSVKYLFGQLQSILKTLSLHAEIRKVESAGKLQVMQSLRHVKLSSSGPISDEWKLLFK